MNEGIFTIEIGSYGFMLDTQWCYVALSWQLIISVTLLTVAYKVYKRVQSNRWAKLVSNELSNDEWGFNEQTTNYTSAISAYRSRPYYGAHDVA